MPCFKIRFGLPIRNYVPAKNGRTIECCKTAYTGLIKFKTDTKYKEQADDMLARVKDLPKIY
jgi:outer membrane protein assembly factor BamD